MNKFSIFPFRTTGDSGEISYYTLISYDQGQDREARAAAGPCTSVEVLAAETQKTLRFLLPTIRMFEHRGDKRELVVSDSIDDYEGDLERFLGEHLEMEYGSQLRLETPELIAFSNNVRDWLMAA